MKIVILQGGADPAMPEGTQRGVTALGGGEGRWVLLNVSATVARQLVGGGSGPLGTVRSHAVVLTDGELEHVGGLLAMRGGPPIDLYATPAVFEDLTTTLPVLPVLQHYCGVHWHPVPVAGDTRVASFRVDGMPTLEFTALATRVPAPPHSAHRHQPMVGDSIALAVRDLVTGQRVFCAPGLTHIGSLEFDWMREADCLLVDGEVRCETPPAVPIGFDWMDVLSGLPARHKVLFSDSAAQSRQALAARGIALAYDGMEIEL